MAIGEFLAEESDLGKGNTSFIAGDLIKAITTLNSVNENYRSLYSALSNYFTNDLKSAVGLAAYTGMNEDYDKRKPILQRVNDFLDELIRKIIKETGRGEDEAEELLSNLRKAR